MDTGWWVRCFRCGGQVDMSEVQRRQALTHVTTITNWFGFVPVRYKHYELVDLCSLCAEQEEEAERRQRTWIAAALIAIATFLFGWEYLAVAAGIAATGAAVMAALFLCIRRPRKIALLPDKRRRYE